MVYGDTIYYSFPQAEMLGKGTHISGIIWQ